jgi:hypothetical protein
LSVDEEGNEETSVNTNVTTTNAADTIEPCAVDGSNGGVLGGECLEVPVGRLVLAAADVLGKEVELGTLETGSHDDDLTLLDGGLAFTAWCDTSLAASELDTIFCEVLDVTSDPAASTLPL